MATTVPQAYDSEVMLALGSFMNQLVGKGAFSAGWQRGAVPGPPGQ